MKTTIALFCLALVIGGCKSEDKTEPSAAALAQQAETERSEARAAIERINSEITRLMREEAFEEAGAYFAPDLVQMIAGQPPIEGRQAWIEAQRQAAEIGEWNLELEVLDFEYLGDAAVERGRGIQRFEANETSPIPSMVTVGDYLVYWERSGDSWQIQYDYVVLGEPDVNMAVRE